MQKKRRVDPKRTYHYGQFEVGDIVFIRCKGWLFRSVTNATGCWANHVGVIVGYDGQDYLVAESRVPLSCITTLTKFIHRSENQRYEIKRFARTLTIQEQERIGFAAHKRLGILYHQGFKLNSKRQFCSKFVHEVYQDAANIILGKVETFARLLERTPKASITFWRIWFIGCIPWRRYTITPNSLYENSELNTVS